MYQKVYFLIHKRGDLNLNKTFGYARVSSTEQSLNRQLDALIAFGIPERDIITDKESGKTLERAGYQGLKTMLRSGDTVVITSLDRLSRNKTHMLKELNYFKSHNIRLIVLDLPTTTVNLPEEQKWILEMVNNILIEVLASMAEQERENIRKRQEEGIRAAKERGINCGRPKLLYNQDLLDNIDFLLSQGVPKSTIASKLHISRSSLYRILEKTGRL